MSVSSPALLYTGNDELGAYVWTRDMFELRDRLIMSINR